jgi:hypothetical protein
MAEVTVEDLLKYYHLTEEVCSQEISDTHINEIAESYCEKWRMLPCYMGMKNIDADGIDRGPGDEEEKRRNYLRKWKSKKATAATYRVLIGALLKIKHRYDAEGVCKILRATPTEIAGKHEGKIT